METQEDIFGPCISRYSDADAIEDGVLVALDKRDRATVNVYSQIAKIAEDQKTPPDRWTVDLFGYCRAKTGEARALAMMSGLIGDVRMMQPRNAERRDDTFAVRYAVIGPRGFSRLTTDEPTDGHFLSLLIMTNEVGGLTLMLPEDN